MSSPNFILIRGLIRNNQHWGIFYDLLLKNYPDSEIVLLELPGNGKKYQETSALSVADYVEQLRQEWLARKKQSHNWKVIAVSLGAMVALKWASKYNDFDQIFLINTSSADVANPLNRLSKKALMKVVKLFFSKDSFKIEKAILELTLRIKKVDDELITKWAAIADKYPVSRKNLMRQLIAASKFISPKTVNANVTFMAGRYDALANYRCSEKLAKKYNSSYFLHESAGHDLPLEDTDWVLDKIKRNLE